MHLHYMGSFLDTKVDVKIKLAFFWASVMFFYLYGDYFELYAPGKVQGLVDGNNLLNSPARLLFASILLSIPALMIPLTMILRPQASRFLNILFGSLFTLLMLFIGINSLSPWYSFYVLYAFIESLLTALIVFYAWKWPRTF